MTLNIKYWSGAGKLVYCFCDIVSALLMRNILSKTTKLKTKDILHLLCFWIFNPIVIYVTVHGYEVPIKVMLIMFVLCLLIHRKISFAGIFLGLAIHIDAHLIVTVLPIFLWIDYRRKRKVTKNRLKFLFFVLLIFFVLLWFFYM